MRGLSVSLAIGKPVWKPQVEISWPMFRITFAFFALWIVADDLEMLGQDIITWRKDKKHLLWQLETAHAPLEAANRVADELHQENLRMHQEFRDYSGHHNCYCRQCSRFSEKYWRPKDRDSDLHKVVPYFSSEQGAKP